MAEEKNTEFVKCRMDVFTTGQKENVHSFRNQAHHRETRLQDDSDSGSMKITTLPTKT